MSPRIGTPGYDPSFPEEVRELDRMLSSIHFEPRASLGPELQGRIRRNPSAEQDHHSRVRAVFELTAVLLLLCLAIFVLWTTVLGVAHGRQVDQCCWDLDGGGWADDGVLVEANPDESVRRLTIYEDTDGSGRFDAGDLIRFVRGPDPVLQPAVGAASSFHHCCRDYDGGGKADDGILVVSVPPDRIVMASIYDTRRTTDSSDVTAPARPVLR